jgi:hypothetical protein
MSDPIADLQKWTDLTMKAVKAAAARALNRTATSTRAEISRTVRASIPSLKASAVKDTVTIIRAKGGTDLLSQRAEIKVKDVPVPLAAYGAKPKTVATPKGKRVGVTVKVKDARKPVVGAFVATVGAGHVGVFKRRGPDRLPIKELYGPSVAQVVRSTSVMTAILRFTRETFAKNFRSELAYQRSKAQGS